MRLMHWLWNLQSAWHPGTSGANDRRTGRSAGDRYRKPARRFRPQLEALEGRTLPSTFTVNTLNDVGPGSLRAAIGYYRAIKRVIPKALRARLPCPTVTFAGQDDGVLRISDYEPSRRFFTGPYEIVSMPGGHFLHREHPERFEAELLRALSAHAPR